MDVIGKDGLLQVGMRSSDCGRGAGPELLADGAMDAHMERQVMATGDIGMGEAIGTQVRDNPARGRYELEIDGQIAFANYRRDGTTLVIPHVEAPPALRGTGAAGRLMEAVMRIARAEGLKVVPTCGYAAAWLRRHREWSDVAR